MDVTNLVPAIQTGRFRLLTPIRKVRVKRSVSASCMPANNMIIGALRMIYRYSVGRVLATQSATTVDRR